MDAVKVYSVIVAVCVFLGSLAEVELVWTIHKKRRTEIIPARRLPFVI